MSRSHNPEATYTLPLTEALHPDLTALATFSPALLHFAKVEPVPVTSMKVKVQIPDDTVIHLLHPDGPNKHTRGEDEDLGHDSHFWLQLNRPALHDSYYEVKPEDIPVLADHMKTAGYPQDVIDMRLNVLRGDHLYLPGTTRYAVLDNQGFGFGFTHGTHELTPWLFQHFMKVNIPVGTGLPTWEYGLDVHDPQLVKACEVDERHSQLGNDGIRLTQIKGNILSDGTTSVTHISHEGTKQRDGSWSVRSLKDVDLGAIYTFQLPTFSDMLHLMRLPEAQYDTARLIRPKKSS